MGIQLIFILHNEPMSYICLICKCVWHSRTCRYESCDMSKILILINEMCINLTHILQWEHRTICTSDAWHVVERRATHEKKQSLENGLAFSIRGMNNAHLIRIKCVHSMGKVFLILWFNSVIVLLNVKHTLNLNTVCEESACNAFAYTMVSVYINTKQNCKNAKLNSSARSFSSNKLF